MLGTSQIGSTLIRAFFVLMENLLRAKAYSGATKDDGEEVPYTYSVCNLRTSEFPLSVFNFKIKAT